MRFLISRLSNKKAPPMEGAREVGRTLFGDPVYGVEANTIEELLNLATRSRTSAPGDVGLIVWKKAPQSMSLPPELEDYAVVEIYDEIIA
jgi:hypothetical protein